MANPVTTARVAPTGKRLLDGYKCVVAFARDSNVNLWEMEVQPAGLDGGDKIDTTTMHNARWRTAAARSLITSTDGSFKCAYDPAVATEILNLLNEPGSITYHYPDGSTMDVWGYLKSFEPDALVEGSMPSATVSICHTNTDPSDHSEAGPVITSVAGT